MGRPIRLMCCKTISKHNVDVPRAFGSVVLALSDAQRAHWASYLATGRGSVALFASIDKDEDNLLSLF